MADAVLYEIRENIAWVTLNRPQSLNAVNGDMAQALLDIFHLIAKDSSIRVVILTGAGRAFCAGGDIYEMAAGQGEAVREFQNKIQTLSRVMRNLDKPILAAINGFALGAGVELALMCDLRIASSSAVFGIPDAQLGISPGGGMTYLLPRVIGHGRSMHLALKTDSFDAVEAERIGLVTQIVPPEELFVNMTKLGERLASFPSRGLSYMKRAYYMASEATFEATLKIEEEYDVGSFRSSETRAALEAFLDSRKKTQKNDKQGGV